VIELGGANLFVFRRRQSVAARSHGNPIGVDRYQNSIGLNI
jgi:hypothetical protein